MGSECFFVSSLPQPFELAVCQRCSPPFGGALLQFFLHVGKVFLDPAFHRLVEAGKEFRYRYPEDHFVSHRDKQGGDHDRPFVLRNLDSREEANDLRQFPLAQPALSAMRPKVVGDPFKCHECCCKRSIILSTFALRVAGRLGI